MAPLRLQEGGREAATGDSRAAGRVAYVMGKAGPVVPVKEPGGARFNKLA
jgi:hypothetical protein